VYLRRGYEEQLQVELEALQKYFVVVTDLDEIQRGDRVLARFSTLPFSEFLEEDVKARGAVLVQSASSHSYLADARSWYPDLVGITPRTWFALEDVDADAPGPYFVKGITNSNKRDWENVFAATREDLPRVLAQMMRDPLLAQQSPCIREFVRLRSWGVHPQTNFPITEEYRCFVAGGVVLSRGYYWSEQLPMLKEQGIVPDGEAIPEEFLLDVIARVGAKADYYVVDVARSEDGEWLVVELNDATMSGIAANDAEGLYRALSEQMREA
jgi:hypothetical protein